MVDLPSMCSILFTFSCFIVNRTWEALLSKGEVGMHVSRWYKFCSAQDIFKKVSTSLKSVTNSSGKENNEPKSKEKKTGGGVS